MKRHISSILAMALACSVAVPSSSLAQARTLFDLLFEDQNRQVDRETRPAPRGPAVVPSRPAAPRQAVRPRPNAPAVPASRYFAYKPAPLVRLAAADLLGQVEASTESAAPIADAGFVKAIAASQGVEILIEKPLRDALVAYYRTNPGFLWTDGQGPNAKASSVAEVFAAAADVGLNPRDYTVEGQDVQITSSIGGSETRDALRHEMTMSAMALRYAHDALNGRIVPNKVSDYHDFQPKPFNGVAFLKSLKQSNSPANALLAQNPDNAQFGALAAELRALRAQGREEGPSVPADILLKPGQDNPALPDVLKVVANVLGPTLTEEQRVVLYENRDATIYGPTLVPLVKAAQQARGVKPDGVVGPATMAALQGRTLGDKVRKVRLAMEQLRWLPRTFGDRHVFINQPQFWASYVENGKEALGMRVVVGTKANQTSFFQDQIEYVEFNPYWGVPKSILVNEMLPKLQRDPSYLDRIGYEVYTQGGQQVSSSAVDWWNGGANRVTVRQPPSEKNALGELKIMFPNKHDIYMHDTPQRDLFVKEVRAFSHGCVRLHQPRDMAAAVLGVEMDTVEARLALGHNSLKLDKPIPIYVSYFTAWPDQGGKVQYYEDVYARDASMLKAISATEAMRHSNGPNEG